MSMHWTIGVLAASTHSVDKLDVCSTTLLVPAGLIAILDDWPIHTWVGLCCNSAHLLPSAGRQLCMNCEVDFGG